MHKRYNLIRHILIIAIALAILSVTLRHFSMWFLDDAFISMRYARNWVEGNGLVFNEGERVEGYTNFAWVALLAGGYLLDLNVPRFARSASIFFTVGTLIVLYLASIVIFTVPWYVAGSVITLFVINGDTALWANSGMETTMFGFFVTGACVLYLFAMNRARGWLLAAGCTLVAAALTRPEGMLVAAIIVIHHIYRSSREKKSFSATMPDVAVLCAPFIAIYLPYFLIRWQYYGYLLPNTFYAKVGGSGNQLVRGLRYVGSYLSHNWFLVIPGLIGFLIVNKRTKAGFVPMLIGIYFIYIAAIGGDIFPGYRFVMPLTPLLYGGLAIIMSTMVSGKNRLYRTIVWSFVIFIAGMHLLQYGYRTDYRNAYIDQVSAIGKKIGVWMRKTLPADTVVALNAVGALPYFSRLHVIDMLGLTDEHIAHTEKSGTDWAGHESGDGAYVLERRPEIIIFGAPWGHMYPRFKTERDLFESDVFHERYVLYNTFLPPDDILFQCYVRTDAVDIRRQMEIVKIRQPIGGLLKIKPD